MPIPELYEQKKNNTPNLSGCQAYLTRLCVDVLNAIYWNGTYICLHLKSSLRIKLLSEETGLTTSTQHSLKNIP